MCVCACVYVGIHIICMRLYAYVRTCVSNYTIYVIHMCKIYICMYIIIYTYVSVCMCACMCGVHKSISTLCVCYSIYARI